MDFSPDVRKIIEEHQHDFWLGTYSSVVKDFKKYVTSLGSIFRKWCGYQKPPVSKEEYQERVQYEQGLMAIWKFCYWNGSKWHYFMQKARESFYHAEYHKCNTRSVDRLCQGDGARTTNCNYGIDSLLISFGMFKKGTADFNWYLQNYKEVKSKRDLKPGDLVHFFTAKQDDSWDKSKWRHIAIVYEVTKDGVWLADFGRRFITTGKPFHYMPIDDSIYAGGDYNYYWKAIHIMDLESARDNAVKFYAEQVRAWDRFKEVPNFTEAFGYYQEYLEFTSNWLDDAADYVLDGKAGSGEERKAFFGSEYEAVQNRVNYIIQMAQDVIIGKYGSGEVRKKALNGDYDIIQREVNRLLDH